MVYVDGELTKDSYEDKDGNKRISYYVKANDIKLVERNPNAEEGEQENSAPTAKKSSNRPPASKQNKENQTATQLEDDDVPF